MALRVSDEEFRLYLRRMGKAEPGPANVPRETVNKYHNKRVVVDGHTFDSKGEASRWLELRTMERAGVIADLKRQAVIPIQINGITVCSYKPDFVYWEKGVEVWEDFKGMITETYALKKKLVYAVHGKEIKETRKRSG